MYELLIRIETLLRGLNPLIALGIGAPAVVIGLVLWFAGSRYSAYILGVLGAIVGAFCGMLVDQLLGFNLLLSMVIGAAILAAASVLLKNVLIIVLAILVCAALSGAGYLTVVLDKHIEQDTAGAQPSFLVQSFSNMDHQSRLTYLDQLSDRKEGFSERIRRLVRDTWDSLGPNRWKLIASVVIGGLVGLLLVWFIKKAVVALAYSVVGSTMIILGLQSLLLAPRIGVISALNDHRSVVPAVFASMVLSGWLCQLVFFRKAQPVAEKKAKGKD